MRSIYLISIALLGLGGCAQQKQTYASNEAIEQFREHNCPSKFHIGVAVTVKSTGEKGYVTSDGRYGSNIGGVHLDPQTNSVDPSQANRVCDGEIYTVTVHHPVNREYTKELKFLSRDDLLPREHKYGGSDCKARPSQSCPID